MKFIDPSFKELYDTLHNNAKLEKFFISQKILIGMDEYYENYGYNNKNKESAYTIIKEENEKVYNNLTDLLLPNLNFIKKYSISELIAKQYLKDEIRFACGFDGDTKLADDVLWEIFYCVKYCYTTSFFQNNWESFVPKYDFENIESNPALNAFLDSIMKEFDKLDYILDSYKDFKDYQKIPYDYIVYLTQLLGVEPKDFMIMKDQQEKYRCLAENIMDVYSVRGTPASFELLFNFLGYTLNVEEYFFDRRRYCSLNDDNEEMVTNDVTSYKYYMTTKDPRHNLLTELGTNEIVNDNDITEKHNIRDFDELVQKYGLRCVLGYDDEYVVENRSDDGELVYTTDIKKYDGPVYKYFRTNYIRVKPSLKYSAGNFTLDQLYQISAILNFIIPEFITRETYVLVDIGKSDDKFVLNWNRDEELDDFFMLDSETWEQNFAEKYLTNYYDSDRGTGYLNSGYTILPMRRRDNGTEDVYVNSLGLSEHYSGGKQNNVFFNPISEKIKIVNTTKYWGDKVKIDSSNKALYPVYRITESYVSKGMKFYAPQFLDGKRQVTELYMPKDARLVTEREQYLWDSLEKVGLNGFNGASLKNRLRDKAYGDRGYYNFNNKKYHAQSKEEREFLVSRQEIDLVIDGKLVDFLRQGSDEGLSENDKKHKEHFFEKKWLKTDNYVWKYKFSFDVSNTEFLKGFVDKHRNVINYDYINGKLFCSPEYYNMSFSTNSDRLLIKNAYASSPAEMNAIGTELINTITDPFSYMITLDITRKKYAVYQCLLLNRFDSLWFNKFRPVPMLTSYVNKELVGNQNIIIFDTNQTPNFTFSTYGQILDCMVDDWFIYSESFQKEITSSNDLIFYVISDNLYYKLVRLPTTTKKVLHANINATVNAVNLLDIDTKETLEKKLIGSFYMSTFKRYDSMTADEIVGEAPVDNDTRMNKIVDARTPKIFQYRYANIKKNMTIYSKSEQKVYRINFASVFHTDDTINVNGYIYNKKEETVEQKGGMFGVEELNFYGRMVFEEKDGVDHAYIYEYDDQYPGFSEQDDDDNYIFNNYEREYVWKNMKVATGSIKTFVDEAGTIQMAGEDYTRLTNKRPIKVNIDKIFEERDSKEFYQKKDENGKPIEDGILLNKNVLSSSILKEICDSYGSDYRQKDRIVLLN